MMNVARKRRKDSSAMISSSGTTKTKLDKGWHSDGTWEEEKNAEENHSQFPGCSEIKQG